MNNNQGLYDQEKAWTAEDRAVEFGEWISKKNFIAIKYGHDLWQELATPKIFSTKQLYQIFLKETSSNGEGKE